MSSQTIKNIHMDLKKSHREAFLNRLNEVNENIEIKKAINLSWHNAEEKDKPSDHSVDWHDVDMFLLTEEKKLIETSLADNLIDF